MGDSARQMKPEMRSKFRPILLPDFRRVIKFVAAISLWGSQAQHPQLVANKRSLSCSVLGLQKLVKFDIESQLLHLEGLGYTPPAKMIT